MRFRPVFELDVGRRGRLRRQPCAQGAHSGRRARCPVRDRETSAANWFRRSGRRSTVVMRGGRKRGASSPTLKELTPSRDVVRGVAQSWRRLAGRRSPCPTEGHAQHRETACNTSTTTWRRWSRQLPADSPAQLRGGLALLPGGRTCPFRQVMDVGSWSPTRRVFAGISGGEREGAPFAPNTVFDGRYRACELVALTAVRLGSASVPTQWRRGSTGALIDGRDGHRPTAQNLTDERGRVRSILA